MKQNKKSRLEKMGWKVGSVEEFLGLTPEESAYIELRLALSDAVRKQRQARRVTQHQLAELLESSQSRVAKMEAGDDSVSVDLLVRSLFAMGTTRKDLAKLISNDTSGRRRINHALRGKGISKHSENA